MPYCSSDGKLAGYDEPEAELNSEDCSGDTVSAEVHVVRPCATCGDEASTYDASLEGTIEHECFADSEAKACEECAHPHAYPEKDAYGPCEEPECDCSNSREPEPEFEVDFDDPEVEDYYQTVNPRTGKPIRNPRYQKHLYAVTVNYSGECTYCGEGVGGSIEERDIAASSFDTETSH